LRAIGVFGSGAPSRVLCLGAHSDDIEIGCGATVLRLLEECPKTQFTWVVLSATPEREREARSSAASFLVGAKSADIRVERFRESHFPWEGSRIKDRLAGIAREIDPELVLTHWRGDKHQDHRTVAELTWNHFRDHLILEYEIPEWDGDLGRPNCHEHYNPLTGQACVYRGIDDYMHSWVIDLIIRGVAGVEPSAAALRVDPLPMAIEEAHLTGLRVRGRRVEVRRAGGQVRVDVDGTTHEARVGEPLGIGW